MNMKRNFSDMDNSDDVFVDVIKNCQSEGDSCQMLNRKKRRGVIEKKRRDRINNSLTELRRLVPSAFEKQGSAKLEKAEILQLTVDHLKALHAKGFDTFSFDPQRFAMDYHGLGFRECAAEVARYLVTIEGMDVQDPLRLRLMSHLQCCSAQKELAAKSAAAAAAVTNPWTAGTSSSTNNNTSVPAVPPSIGSSAVQPPQFHPSAPNPSSVAPLPPSSSLSYNDQNYHHLPYSHLQPESSPFSSGMGTNNSVSSHQRFNTGCALPASSGQYSSSTLSTSFNSSFSPTGYSNTSMLNNSLPSGPLAPTVVTPVSAATGTPSVSAINSGSMRPYRPWGTEFAY